MAIDHAKELRNAAPCVRRLGSPFTAVAFLMEDSAAEIDRLKSLIVEVATRPDLSSLPPAVVEIVNASWRENPLMPPSATERQGGGDAG